MFDVKKSGKTTIEALWKFWKNGMYHQPMILKSYIAHAAEINVYKLREPQTKSNRGKEEQ